METLVPLDGRGCCSSFRRKRGCKYFGHVYSFVLNVAIGFDRLWKESGGKRWEVNSC